MPQDTAWSVPNSNADGYPDSENLRDSMGTLIVESDYTSQKSRFEIERDNYSAWAFPVTLLLLAIIWIIIKLKHGNSDRYVEIGTPSGNIENEETGATNEYLRYEGRLLNFSQPELIRILNRRLPYFTSLSHFEKDKFIQRLKKFIAAKTFKIYDKSGFKEMPVLVSGAAIQLSFGLEKYLLPDFPYINIFPREFIAMHPTIRFLEGNVSGNSINISWKHFLKGFELPEDGQNVGLHEMAHAYYFQNFETRNNIDTDFVSTFSKFNNLGNIVFEREHIPGNDLYTEYALKSFQEFWAESIEIFFEKPHQLRMEYPDLYTAMSDLLNQEPANKFLPV